MVSLGAVEEVIEHSIARRRILDDYDGYDGVGVTCSIEDYPQLPRYFAYAKSHSICLLMYALLVLQP